MCHQTRLGVNGYPVEMHGRYGTRGKGAKKRKKKRKKKKGEVHQTSRRTLRGHPNFPGATSSSRSIPSSRTLLEFQQPPTSSTGIAARGYNFYYALYSSGFNDAGPLEYL